jgi:outer membrane receptor for ferrienterochelin and colicins
MEMTRRFIAVLVLVCCALPAFADGGSVAGRVIATTDGRSEPLIGAVVLVQGTVRGTTTNLKGEYRIADLPPGVHTLVFSMIGYKRLNITGVTVQAGLETTIDAELHSMPVQFDQVVVTASRRPQSLEEVPVSISVLDAQEIRERNALVIDDALRYIPGVNMTGFQVNIRGSSGYSRGAGSRVLLLLDGIPFITGDTGELNFESIPVGQVDRIEVVKGASSALYGSNALGGVINVITKEIPDQPSTVVRFFGGMYNKPTYDQWKWSDKSRFYNGQSVSHSYRSGDLGVGLFVSRQFDDGYRRNDYHRRYNVYVKVKENYEKESALTLTFGLLYQYGGQFLYWRSLDSATIPPIAQADDNIKSIRFFTTGQYTTLIGENAQLTNRVMWYHNDWGFETRSGVGRAESVADDIRFESVATIMPNEMHTITAGLDANMDMIGGDVVGGRTIGGFALFGQDELKLATSLSMTFGARFDFSSVGVTTPGGQINPKLAFAYRPFEGTSVRASVARGFRVPAVAEAFLMAGFNNIIARPNEDLKPERSWSFELGVSQRLGLFGTFDIAGFRTEYDNLIEVDVVDTAANSLLFQWRNVAQARIQGVETSLKFGFFEGALQYSLGYTFVYPEDLTQHDILKYRPRHLFYTSLTGQVGPLHASADFRFISKVDRVDDILGKTGLVPDGDERTEILVSDFRLGADFTLGGIPLTATASVNNAFQYNYVELIGNIMPPRTYGLVLEAHM